MEILKKYPNSFQWLFLLIVFFALCFAIDVPEGYKFIRAQAEHIKDPNQVAYSFFGIGNHQIKIKAAIVKRKPINKKGGNCCMAGFAIAKPKPKSSGANSASKMSLNFIRDTHRFDLNT